MGKFARVENGVVLEILNLPDTQTFLVVDEENRAILDENGNFQYQEGPIQLDTIFSPEIIATLFPAGPDVQERWLYSNGVFSAPPPPPEPPYVNINLPVDVFFERTTEEEAEEIETAMLATPVKIKRAYQAATTFKEGTDLWTALRSQLETLFGASRRDELMARPTANEMSRAPAE